MIPLSAATLQKLIEAGAIFLYILVFIYIYQAGAIKPGTQIATPDFSPDM